jgi:hypothetical protein
MSKAGIAHKQVKTSFFEIYAKSKKLVPAPNIYIKQDNWCQKDKIARQDGEFLKEDRKTFTAKHIDYHKKYMFPAADAYKNLEAFNQTQLPH